MQSRANGRKALRELVRLSLVRRAARRIVPLAPLGLLLVSACTDDGPQRLPLVDAGDRLDASPSADAANTDAGPAPAMDAGPSIPVVMCGEKECAPHQPSLVERFVAAGCALDHQDAEVCGLASPDAGATFDGSTPPFLPKEAPGTPSTSCGALLESQLERPTDAAVDAGDSGYPNAQIDVRGAIYPDGQPLEIVRVYPGCCTALGACGVDSRNGLAIQAFGRLSYNAGYGCVDPSAFFAAFAPVLPATPCDPRSGLILQQPDAGSDAGRDAGPSDAGADADAGDG